MEKLFGILDVLAEKYGVFISDLRMDPQLRQIALWELHVAKNYIEGKAQNE